MQRKTWLGSQLRSSGRATAHKYTDILVVVEQPWR